MIKLLCCLAIGWGLSLQLGYAQRPITPKTPEEWLRFAMRAERDLRVSGTRVTEIRSGVRSMRIEERFWRLGERAMRVEVVAPAERKGEVFLLRSNQWIHYRQGEKRLRPLPAIMQDRDQILQRLIRAMGSGMLQAELKEGEMVGQRRAVLLGFNPKESRPNVTLPPALSEAELWIDRETGLILRREMTAANSTMRVRLEITQFTLNPPLPPDLFTPPDGLEPEAPARGRFESFEQAQKVVDFKLKTPGFVPEGMELRGIFLMPFGDKTIVGARYAGPANSFSFFQVSGVDRRFRPPMMNRVGEGEQAHFWQEGGYWFGLIGSLRKPMLERIAQSVR
ncbi:MAG: hypothetical protein KIT45_07555 [Fimbriimonadia bacterium]|nr:hypothetical protein [Fimbriimonadia bacterium]